MSIITNNNDLSKELLMITPLPIEIIQLIQHYASLCIYIFDNNKSNDNETSICYLDTYNKKSWFPCCTLPFTLKKKICTTNKNQRLMIGCQYNHKIKRGTHGIFTEMIFKNDIYMFDTLTNVIELKLPLLSSSNSLFDVIHYDNKMVLCITPSDPHTWELFFSEQIVKWNQLPCMQHPRRHPIVIVVQMHIYVCGGVANSGTSDICERYDIASSTWELLSNLPYPLIASYAYYYNTNQILLAGGKSTYWSIYQHHDNRFSVVEQYRTLDTVLAYNIISNKWTCLDWKLPAHLNRSDDELRVYYDALTRQTFIVSHNNCWFSFLGENEKWNPLPKLPELYYSTGCAL